MAGQPVYIRLQPKLLERYDSFANEYNMSRSALLALCINVGFNLLEVMVDPSNILSDPEAAAYLANAMQTALKKGELEEIDSLE